MRGRPRDQRVADAGQGHGGLAPRDSSGVTLLELVLVVIIVGLLAGGILMGRELLEVAGVRRQASQVAEYDAALGAFRLKYGCWPGDCLQAVELGLGSAGGPGDNGDGNGVVEITNIPHLRGSELQGFWHHLGQAGLIDKTTTAGGTPGVHSPPLRLPGTGVGGGSRGGGVWLSPFGTAFSGAPLAVSAWVLTTTSGGNQVSGIYLPSVAQALDSKLDDGLPAAGHMRAAANLLAISCLAMGGQTQCSGLTPTLTSLVSDACVDDSASPWRYNVQTKVPTANSLCTPVIKWRQ